MWDEAKLKNSLENLDPRLKQELSDHQFDPLWLIEQARLSASGARSNLVTGDIQSPAEAVVELPRADSPEGRRLIDIGETALREGRCAMAVLAGGMATRMGGVVKALVEPVDGKSFLELRLKERSSLAERYGTAPPLWLMTSPATHHAIGEALGSRADGQQIATFCQQLSLRLTEDAQLFLDDQGAPSIHAPGHGDFFDALNLSQLLQSFAAQGGTYLFVTNLDNLGGGLDPLQIGSHIDAQEAVSCEVVKKRGSDRGGIPAKLDGRAVILEEFRIPPSFDPTTVEVFNVNSFHFDIQALLSLQFEWTYFEVQKKVKGSAVLQYERLINEVTFHLPTRYPLVPRSGIESRFLPIKDLNELEQRKTEVEALASSRHML